MEVKRRTVKAPDGIVHAYALDATKTICGKHHLGWTFTGRMYLKEFRRVEGCAYCAIQWAEDVTKEIDMERNKLQTEHDDKVRRLHREIRKLMRDLGYEYRTGSYEGVCNATLNFENTKGQIATITTDIADVEVDPNRPAPPPKSK